MVFNIGFGQCVLSTRFKRANSGGYLKLPGQADKVDYFPFSYFLQLDYWHDGHAHVNRSFRSGVFGLCHFVLSINVRGSLPPIISSPEPFG